MKNDEKHILIKGKFSAMDAKEVLLSLINHKINFHELKNFSAQERFGKIDNRSLERVKDLREMKTRVLAIIDEAERENKNLKIDSLVKISLRK
jgi:hypothetical protein